MRTSLFVELAFIVFMTSVLAQNLIPGQSWRVRLFFFLLLHMNLLTKTRRNLTSRVHGTTQIVRSLLRFKKFSITSSRARMVRRASAESWNIRFASDMWFWTAGSGFYGVIAMYDGYTNQTMYKDEVVSYFSNNPFKKPDLMWAAHLSWSNCHIANLRFSAA
jgi:hypothetical protein